MKNIVVGIDFSENSINSMRHATAIALKTKADMHLVWVKTPGVTKGLASGNKSDYINLANQKLDELVKICKAEASENVITKVILEGKPFIELPRYADSLKNSMIVLGTHGVSGFEEMFVGSNALKIASGSKVPVLVLREGIKIRRDLTQILVPVDISFETLQKVKPAIEFAKAFAAKILLVGFYFGRNMQEKHVVSIQLSHAETLCAKANVRHETLMHKYKGSIAPAIVKYANDKDVNLMVIMRESEGEGDVSNLWLGNTTQQLLNHTPMPLLIIPNVNHFSISK